MSSYSEKLRDPRWQRRRLEIMQQAGFTCEECGSTDKTLTVHHRVYRVGSEPWAYPDHELACLCEDCHDYEHKMSQADRDALDAEARELGHLDHTDLKLQLAKDDCEARRRGFRCYVDWVYDEYKKNGRQ